MSKKIQDIIDAARIFEEQGYPVPYEDIGRAAVAAVLDGPDNRQPRRERRRRSLLDQAMESYLKERGEKYRTTVIAAIKKGAEHHGLDPKDRPNLIEVYDLYSEYGWTAAARKADKECNDGQRSLFAWRWIQEAAG